MWRILLGMIVGGGALLFFGFKESTLSSKADSEPQGLTCADLAAQGPGDNAHVTMWDFVLCDQAFVYEADPDRGPWDKIWVPAVPLDGEWIREIEALLDEDGNLPDDFELPMPRNINVIVMSSRVENDDDMTRLGDQDSITGTIINEIDSLGAEERRMLEESYPGIDMKSCWILQHGRVPAASGKIVGYYAGGVALMVLGVAGFFVMPKRNE